MTSRLDKDLRKPGNNKKSTNVVRLKRYERFKSFLIFLDEQQSNLILVSREIV